MSEYFMMSCVCLVVYLMLYTLLDRICRCFEHCANAKHYTEYMRNINQNGEKVETCHDELIRK